MDIERIIRVWKDDEGQWNETLPVSPIGVELTEEELWLVSGTDCSVTIVCGSTCPLTCDYTITIPCKFSCGLTCVSTAAAQ